MGAAAKPYVVYTHSPGGGAHRGQIPVNRRGIPSSKGHHLGPSQMENGGTREC